MSPIHLLPRSPNDCYPFSAVLSIKPSDIGVALSGNFTDNLRKPFALFPIYSRRCYSNSNWHFGNIISVNYFITMSYMCTGFALRWGLDSRAMVQSRDVAYLFSDLQSPLTQRFGLLVLPSLSVQHGQVVERRSNLDIAYRNRQNQNKPLMYSALLCNRWPSLTMHKLDLLLCKPPGLHRMIGTSLFVSLFCVVV